MREYDEGKLTELRRIIAEMDGVLVAFSGGVDSTFLAKVAHDVLGSRALAVTATSPLYPAWELEEALSLARSLGLWHQVIAINELEIDGFSQNPPDRCYHCKGELFTHLWALAKKEGLSQVLDGANVDDDLDYRPGSRATRELKVRSPLKEAGLGKREIREYSRLLGLPTWDKASFACMASRFPYGTNIDATKLSQVEKGENLLRELGFRQYRVRHHGNLARVEIDPADFSRLLEKAPLVVSRLKEQGFIYVTLDLAGYRLGSSNETLGRIEDHEQR